MSPPAFVGIIVRPSVLISEQEEIPVRTVRCQVSPRLIPAVLLIDLLPVHPFIEGTAVVEHAVQDDPHPPLMDLLHKAGKKLIAGLQIFPVRGAHGIPLRIPVVRRVSRHKPALIFYDHAVMRIDVLVILTVVLMVRRRHEHRTQVEDLHLQTLKIV